MAFPPANPANLIVTAEPIPGCGFEYDNGSQCLDLKLFARGLCCKHYNQLRRIGAFSQKPTADAVDVISNVAEERLSKARDILIRAAPSMARLVARGAKVAATKGDIKPAAWALLHSRAVEPVTQNRPDVQTNLQPVINIGFAVAGITATKTITLPETGDT
jgi:hypothetical protein